MWLFNDSTLQGSRKGRSLLWAAGVLFTQIMLPHLAISCWNFVFFWPIWQHCRQMDAALALWLKYRSHLTSINTLLSILCSIHPPWAGENQLPEIFQYLLFELCFYSIFFFLRSVRIWSTARLTEVRTGGKNLPEISQHVRWSNVKTQKIFAEM